MQERSIFRKSGDKARTPVGPMVQAYSREALQALVQQILPLILSAVWFLGARVRRVLHRFVATSADPFVVAVFRIAFAAIAICFVVSSIHYIEFTWYENTSALQQFVSGIGLGSSFHQIILAAHGAWIALLALILLGVGGRLVSLLHLVLACTLLTCDDLGSTVSEDQYLIASFWMIFVRLDGCLSLSALWRKRRDAETVAAAPLPAAWPIFLLGVNNGVRFLSAGFTKVYDPFWIRGLGFYETFSLPWIKPAWLSFVRDYQPLLVALNYVAIAMELSVLPLFLLRRTRTLAIVLFGLFFAQLTFPLRVDYIGPIGVTHFLLLSAISPSLTRGIRWLGARLRLLPPDAPAAPPAQAGLEQSAAGGLSSAPASPFRYLDRLRYLARRVLAVTAAGYVALHSMFAVLNTQYDFKFRYPAVANDDVAVPRGGKSMSKKLTTAEDLAIRVRNRVIWLSRVPYLWAPAKALNDSTTGILPKTLFSADHFFGLYEYRMVLETTDGRKLEPVRVFLEDKSGGPYCIAPGTPRYMQRCMYEITGICYRRISYPSDPVPPQDFRLMEGLLHFARVQLPPAEQAQVTKAQLLVSPMVLPIQYEGDSHPWEQYPWTVLYERDYATSQSRFVETPRPYPYRLETHYVRGSR